MKCKTCKAPCVWRGTNGPEHGTCLVGYVPITNGDKIRQMSDEELAAWFGASESFCPPGCYETNDCDACPEICTGHWMAWLKQEAKEET